MPGTTRWTRSVAAAALLAGLLAACAEAPKPKPVAVARGEWGAEINEASRRFDIPEEWIRAVMQVESGGQTHWKGGQPITSHAGAMGLMQVMPGTYDELRYTHGLGPDAYEPRDNILAGAAYIREMYDLYGYPGFLGAYNAGPERYRQYVEEGRPLPRETQRYMDMISPQIAGIMPGQGGGSDRMTQYAAAQIREKVPAGIRMAPIPDGSSMGRTTIMASMQPIPDGSSRSPVIVAQMQPIPDGSSAGNTVVMASMQPIPDGSSRSPVVVAQMQPIPDGSSTASPVVDPLTVTASPEPLPAPVQRQPIPDGGIQVAAVAPIQAAPAPVRMAPIPEPQTAAPVARAATPVPTRVAPTTRPSDAGTAVAMADPAAMPARRAVAAPARMAPIPDAAPTRVASTRRAAASQQQVADASEPRRQSNGLPSGWYVPSATGK